MVKAKDLLEKTQEDESEASDEHERVHEAYEDITKRLEALRNGKKDEDADESKESEDEVDPLDKDADLSEEEIEEKNEQALSSGNEEEEEKMSEAPANAVEPVEKEPEESKESKESEEDVKTFGERDRDENKEVDSEDIEEFNDKDESEEPKEQVKSEEKEETLDDLASESIEKKEGLGSKSEYYSRLEAAEDTTHIPPLGGSSGSTQERHDMNDYSTDGSEEAKPAYPSDYKSSINRYPLGGERPRRASKLHLLILILIGLAVIGGTVYLLKNQFSASPAPSPTPPVITETSPTPSPTPEAIDRSKFKVRVLNGTTTSGLAKTVSEKLKGLGYQEDRVGNAPNQEFEVTEIKVKASATGLMDQLTQDLSPDYTASPSSELKDTDTADAEVIIGKK